MRKLSHTVARATCTACGVLLYLGAASGYSAPSKTAETIERSRIAAANMQDAIVVDCQLPGRLIQLGGMRQYLSPGSLQRLTAIDCRTRGGEYTLGDLSSGTLSLKRWLPLAEQGNAEAQYYVARIYANGMNGVPEDYGKAAEWYERASKLNYAAATQELGYLYEIGLGVPQDRIRGLNLQRQASGLGEELDYAWKVTAANDEAATRTAALSDQLESANAQLETTRLQLAAARDDLASGQNRQADTERKVLTLRAELKNAQDAGETHSAEHVKELQSALTTKEAELTEAQLGADRLRGQLTVAQSQVDVQMQQSQATSQQLNELLGSRQDENKSLRARLAQSEQRYLHSQEELSGLRQEYQRDVDRLSAQREELDRARAQTHSNDGAALLAAKEHELQMQTLRTQALEGELATLRRSQTDSSAVSAQTKQTESQNSSLRADVGALQARYNEQAAQLKASKDELASLRTKSDSERAAMFAKASDQLAALTSQLTAKQRRIDSLDSDSSMLKDELSRLKDQQAQQVGASQGEAERARGALQAAQQRIAAQNDQLDQLRNESAKERASLLADRETLRKQVADGQKANDDAVGELQREIQLRQGIIDAKEQRIASLEKKLRDQPPLMAANIPTRFPVATVGASPPTGLKFALPANTGIYYALVIGNTNYHFMTGLLTPSSDAQSVAELLEQNYGFKVTKLLDATSDTIMRTLDNYSIELKEDDHLLIYYAGHGGAQDGPPERAFWLGVDADPRTRAGWISAEYVGDKIKQMRAKHILLVSDSCFSAAITHPTTTTIHRDLNEQRFQIQWARRARMVLTSGQNTPVADISGDRSHSIFAKYFLSVLRQNNGVMSGEMLSYELSSRMVPEATRMGLKQTPTYTSLQDSNHEYGDFFFLPTAAPPVRVASLIE